MDLSQLNNNSGGYLKKLDKHKKTTSNNKKNIPNPNGRPLTQEKPLNCKITINFTQEEKDKIIATSKEKGQTLSTYLRRGLKESKRI